MMPADTSPFLPPFEPDRIPAELRSLKRWAAWRAQWNAKRNKWDKIPVAPGGYGLSTQKPDQWGSFEQAEAQVRASNGKLAGVGLVMTRLEGFVGIDLDRCVAGGKLNSFAAEIVQRCASYAEISPSGTGVRIFVRGDIEADWTSHEHGIECYGGNEARFLTVTGAAINELPIAEAPATIEGLTARYAKEKRKLDVIDISMPDLVDELLLPDLHSLGLPPRAIEFLQDGRHAGDRSRELFVTAVALAKAGLSGAEVLSTLVASPHAMEVALDHRRQDHDRAVAYLWREHCVRGRARASESGIARPEDFDTVPEAKAPVAEKPQRFPIIPAHLFAQRPPQRWLIKTILPEAAILMLYGESGAGKSFVVLDMAAAIARGLPWRGMRTRKGRVVLVVAEGVGGFRNRLVAYAQYHGLDLAELDIGIVEVAPNLLLKDDAVALAQSIMAGGPVALVVIDTLAQATPGANENASEDMGRALAHCAGIHRAVKAPVMLIHHAGKDLSRGSRGWSGLKANADCEIEVSRDGDYRAVRVAKGKDGADGEEMPFRLNTVEIGTDEDGDPITSCVVLHEAAPSEGGASATRKPPKGEMQRLVFRLVGEMADLAEGGVGAGDLIDAAMAQAPTKTRRFNVQRAIDALVESGHIEIADGTVFAI